MTLSDSAEGLGGAGDDTLTASDFSMGYGLEGDDSLTGSDNATVRGGDGDDWLSGSDEAVAEGGAGADLIYAQVDAHGYSGEGDDILFAEDEAVITGGAGNDMLVFNDRGGVTTPEQGDDIYVLGHADGGASLGFGYQSWDAGDRFAIHLGTNDLSNFRFSVTAGSQDGADGPEGEITQIEVIETLEDGSTVSSMLSLRGVYGFNLRDIILYGENIGEEVDWQEYFGENDFIEAGGIETVNGGIGNDHIDTRETAVGYGGEGDDLMHTWGESTAYGGAGNDAMAEFSGATSLYGGAGNDGLSVNGGRAYGGDGMDYLQASRDGIAYGGEGDDSLVAINGGEGHGGEGNDTFSFFESNVSGGAYGGAGDDRFLTAAPPSFGEVASVSAGGAGADLHVIEHEIYARPPGPTAVGVTTITDFDPAEDEIGVLVAPLQIEVISVESSFDAATNTTVVNVVQAFESEPLSQTIAVFRLQGVQSFDTANLRFLTAEDMPA